MPLTTATDQQGPTYAKVDPPSPVFDDGEQALHGLLAAVPRQKDIDALAWLGVAACLHDGIPTDVAMRSVLVVPLNTPAGLSAARQLTDRLRSTGVRAAQLPAANLQHVADGSYSELMARFYKGNADEWRDQLQRNFEIALAREEQTDAVKHRNNDLMTACSAAQALNKTAYLKLLAPVDLLPTGIPSLDTIVGGGLGIGETTILSAGPGAAKTTLAVNIAYNVAHSERPAVILSEEMPTGDIWRLLLCMVAGVPRTRLRVGTLDRDHHVKLDTARTRLTSLPLTVIPPGTVTDRVNLDTLIRQNPDVKLWVLDHADCLDRAEDSLTRLPELAASVLRAAQEVGTHIIVLSHTNKAALSRRVSEHGSRKKTRSFEIEDQRGLVTVTGTYVNVIGLTVDSPRDTPKPELSIHVVKGRYGNSGIVPVQFNRATGRIGAGAVTPTMVAPAVPCPDPITEVRRAES